MDIFTDEKICCISPKNKTIFDEINKGSHHRSPGCFGGMFSCGDEPGGLHQLCQCKNRLRRARTCVRRSERAIRRGAAGTNEHSAVLGLVLGVPFQRLHGHRILAHASERNGNRRPLRHHVDAGGGRGEIFKRGGAEGFNSGSDRRCAGHGDVVLRRQDQGGGETRLLQCSADPLRHHRRNDRHHQSRPQPLHLPGLGQLRGGHRP